MTYIIPEVLKPHIKSLLKECEENISIVLNTPVIVKITINERRITHEMLVALIEDSFQLPWPDIKSRKKSTPYVTARHIYCYVSKKYTKDTVSAIGKRIGQRDHTTVLNSLNVIEGYIKNNDEYVMHHLKPILKQLSLLTDGTKEI